MTRNPTNRELGVFCIHSYTTHTHAHKQTMSNGLIEFPHYTFYTLYTIHIPVVNAFSTFLFSPFYTANKYASYRWRQSSSGFWLFRYNLVEYYNVCVCGILFVFMCNLFAQPISIVLMRKNQRSHTRLYYIL